jgi:hypothetical protein
MSNLTDGPERGTCLDRAAVFTRIFDSTPVTGARILWVTLSVSISTKGSSIVTASPALLNHRPIDNLGPAFAIVGTRISVVMD